MEFKRSLCLANAWYSWFDTSENECHGDGGGSSFLSHTALGPGQHITRVTNASCWVSAFLNQCLSAAAAGPFITSPWGCSKLPCYLWSDGTLASLITQLTFTCDTLLHPYKHYFSIEPPTPRTSQGVAGARRASYFDSRWGFAPTGGGWGSLSPNCAKCDHFPLSLVTATSAWSACFLPLEL